jgi:hypothetical protein
VPESQKIFPVNNYISTAEERAYRRAMPKGASTARTGVRSNDNRGVAYIAALEAEPKIPSDWISLGVVGGNEAMTTQISTAEERAYRRAMPKGASTARTGERSNNN